MCCHRPNQCSHQSQLGDGTTNWFVFPEPCQLDHYSHAHSQPRLHITHAQSALLVTRLPRYVKESTCLQSFHHPLIFPVCSHRSSLLSFLLHWLACYVLLPLSRHGSPAPVTLLVLLPVRRCRPHAWGHLWTSSTDPESSGKPCSAFRITCSA